MELLVGIATKIGEHTVAPVIRQVGYTIHYKKNLKKLQSEVDKLGHARESMRHSIKTEERKGRKIEAGVQKWLTEVNQLTENADSILTDEQHAATKCLQGFCPNIKLRHHLSRKSTKLALEVAEKLEEKMNDFATIAYDASPEEVCTIAIQDYEAFDSRTSTVNDVIAELRKSNTYMIGVYGMGGVGKTTLVKEVYKQVTRGEKLFDDVVMVLDLKQNPSIERIQKEIAEKLGLELSEAGTPAGRATQICNRIKDKKSLVILDDVWEYIDLEAVGLPRMTTLTILLTSRNKPVLASEMGTQKEFPLEVLNREESWSLFKKMAGDIVEKPDIQTIAARVAEKCGGLPLLIVTVARGLKDSQLHNWRDTFRRLNKLDGKGLKEKTYSAIEWSYNKLESEELKSVFMLCVTEVGRTNSAYILDLFKYSMGLDFIKDVDTMAEARDAFYSLLKKLQHSCLLQDGDDDQWIRVHDLVKDVGNHIAARDHHVLSVSHGSELKEWPDKESCEKCTRMSLKNCNIPDFPEFLQCPILTMFHIHSDNVDSREIPSNFFDKMKKLKVLDLTNRNIPSLPPSLKSLKDLQTLCLDACTLEDIALVGQLTNLKVLSFLNSKFKELPKEIGQLTRLQLLDLTECSQLEVISPDVLSKLTKLEELRMGKNSFNKWEHERVADVKQSNASLEELKYLYRLTALQIHIPDAHILPADLFTASKLQRFQICIGSVWKWDDVDEALNALKLHLTTNNEFDQGLKMLLKRTQDLHVEGMEGVNDKFFRELVAGDFHQLKHLHIQNSAQFLYNIIEKVSFPNLTWLAVSELNGIRFLLSSSMARGLSQLKRLQISGCQIMEEIISIEESNTEILENIFCQLQDLELKGLPNLTKFFSRICIEMPKPSHEKLKLEDCTKSSTTSCEEIQEIDSGRILDSVIQHFLFDIKVEFPNLKKLSIHGLAKLTTIWNNNLSLASSKNLETVEIVSCDNLKSIFPALVAKSLERLRTLIVKKCGVEEIISKEDETQTPPMFVFPKLTYVRFEKLPRLMSLYPGFHSSKWPSLVALAVYDCNDEVQIFANPNKKSLFSFEKESFPNLQTLGFRIMKNWDSPPLHLFRKLETLYVYADTNPSLNSLEEVLGLEKVNGEIHAVGDGIFPFLRELHLYGMRRLTNLGDDSLGPAGPYFPKVEILELNDCDSLKNLRSSAMPFRNLTTLQVTRCKGLKYLISFSMAKSLMHLTKFEVGECEELIEIVASCGSDDSANESEFRVLRHLELSGLPSLRGFCSGSQSVKFPSLETLSMSGCTQLEGFLFYPTDEITTIGQNSRDTSSNENTGVVQPFLFDDKVEFPKLKSLSLKGLPTLSTIWHNLPSTQLQSFHCENLEYVKIDYCENLITIFPTLVARNLQLLKRLMVMKSGVKDIVTREEGLQTIPKFVFPKVKCVKFHQLPQLTNFYPGMHVSSWPSLLHLTVIECFKVHKLAEEMSICHGYDEQEHLCNSIPRSLFLIHKDSFPNLERLVFEGSEIWEGQLPVHLFSKLKHLEAAALQSKSAVFLESNSSSSGVVGTGTHWQQQQWQLPHLTELRLTRMEKLMHLGQEDEEDSSQSAPNIPNLQFIRVNGCHSLRNLISSAICFNNLTTLHASCCKRLEYLITYSMANSLMQLTTLEVGGCPRLVVIVGSINEDDDSRNEITFRRLKHLKLYRLPRLQSFCSGNCIAKFPSLETSTMNNRLKLKISAPRDQTL
ncbi:probable disease resistance protein At4g27220 [Argentina anserina]|uniref:probable disease resistance protein At4g27220 n=1 Tax=Argentina anserina TaxID=57926 RepID=UPI0021767990|nr:probable disease resistance protein At4g27220 [Potentilla anserina]